MKKYGNFDLAENSITSLISVSKLKGNQFFSIQKISKTLFNENIENINFGENSIYSLISLTKLKENQNFSNLIYFKNFIQ